MAFVDQVCEGEGYRPVDQFFFRRSPHSWTQHGYFEESGNPGTRILLPLIEYAREHQMCSPAGFYLLALHEAVHHLNGHGGAHHPEKFYVRLFELVDRYGSSVGLTVEFALEDEREYRPRNAPKGYELYLERRGEVAA